MSEIRLSEKIGPAFYSVAKDVFEHGHTHYDESGGRGSLKSSFISIVVPLLLVNNPGTHALVLRKVANTIRDSVYAQYMAAQSTGILRATTPQSAVITGQTRIAWKTARTGFATNQRTCKRRLSG